jgi:hypothetical protein
MSKQGIEEEVSLQHKTQAQAVSIGQEPSGEQGVGHADVPHQQQKRTPFGGLQALDFDLGAIKPAGAVEEGPDPPSLQLIVVLQPTPAAGPQPS